jgi:uridine kinase
MYGPGFLVQYPRAEFNGKIPEFEDAPVFSSALKESSKWGKITKGNNIARMNEYATTDFCDDFINLCETRHNNLLCHLGDTILAQKDEIRLICIAGPSSSGKTTFCKRVKIELMARGLNPIMISIDDYYLERHLVPKDENGNDFLDGVHETIYNSLHGIKPKPKQN